MSDTSIVAEPVEVQVMAPPTEDAVSVQLATRQGFVMPPQTFIPSTVDALTRLFDKHGGDVKQAIIEWMEANRIVRETAIRDSAPEHWVLNKQGDMEIAVPRKAPLLLLKKAYLINVFAMERVQVEKKASGVTVASQRMWGMSNLTGEIVTEVVGERTSSEKFTGRGPDVHDYDSDTHESDLKKAATTNGWRKVIMALSGVTDMPKIELERLGVKTQRCQQGHGYGSGGGRRASATATDEVKASRDTLRDTILQCTGGDTAAAQDLLYEITVWVKDGKEFGHRTVDRLTQDWQVDRAMDKLKAHHMYAETFGGE